MTSWLCLDCGWMFPWIRQGEETRPDGCPECGSENIDVVDWLNMKNITIIIPTYNEESLIEQKLINTLDLGYPKEQLSIIVVDSGSTDRTRQIVTGFPAVKLITEKERKGKAQALITAFNHLDATTEIVVISDADSRLEKDILTNAMKYFKNKDVGAICGRQVLLNPTESKTTKAEKSYRDYYTKLRLLESNIDSNPIMHGEFMAMRRDVMEPPSPDSVADDTEMALKIRRKGYKTLYTPDCVFYEASTTSLKGRLAQKERRGQGLIQVFWRNKDMFLNAKYGKFGLLVFPFEFSLYVLSPFIFFGGLATLGVLAIFFKSFVLLSTLLVLSLAVTFNSIVYSFVTSEFALLKGASKLVTKGSSHSWGQIKETREVMEGYDKR